MWELDDWKWLNRVQELLSQEKTNAGNTVHDLHDLESSKKSKRSPRKKRDYPPPPSTAGDDHPTSRPAGTELKLAVVENHGRNPAVISREMYSFKKPCKKLPGSSKKFENLNLPRNVPPPAAAPDLPQAFKNHILETGGCLDNVVLVIQKELFESDRNKNLNRLSIPYSKVINPQFLTSNEVDYLKGPKAGIQATLVDPHLQECEISLRNWQSNSMFALVSSWNEVCLKNQLTQGNIVQLWSFRRNSELCFSLVVIN